MLIAISVSGTASPAAAQTIGSPSGDVDRAREAASRARSAFDEGRFWEAAKLLRQAYASAPNSTLLYNLGRAYQQAGALDLAIEAYTRYLEAEPDATDRGAVRETIVQLRRLLDQQRRLTEDEARQEAERRSARPSLDATNAREQRPSTGTRSGSILQWSTVGAGVVTIGTGAVFGVLASTAHASARDDRDAASAESSELRRDSYATAANVSFVAGAILLVAGLTWLVLDTR